MTSSPAPRATLLSVPIPSATPVPVVPTSARERRRKRLSRTGVLLLVAGSLLFVVPMAAAHGVCAFVPCSPLTSEIGFSATTDGRTIVETGPVTAADLQEVVVLSGADPSWESPVVWQVERAGDVPAGWSGEVVLGEVPEGFEETVPLTLPLTEGTAVGVSNDCYGTITSVLPGPFTPGVVTTEYDLRTVDQFHADDLGFTPCPPEHDPARLYAGVGLVGGAVGLVLVIVARLRYGPPPRRPTA